MTSRIDLFKADRAMADRVADFMQKKVWGITLKARCKAEIALKESDIASLKRLAGSIFDNDENDANIAKLEADIEDFKTKLKDQLEEEATFAYIDADNAFYNSYKKAADDGEIATAIEDWFKTWNLDVSNDYAFVADFRKAISGSRKATATQVIRSEATKFVDSKRSKGDILNVFYGVLAEKMLVAGTLKATAIPEDVREMYAPKKKDKKEKKSKKNNSENN